VFRSIRVCQGLSGSIRVYTRRAVRTKNAGSAGGSSATKQQKCKNVACKMRAMPAGPHLADVLLSQSAGWVGLPIVDVEARKELNLHMVTLWSLATSRNGAYEGVRNTTKQNLAVPSSARTTHSKKARTGKSSTTP
jgi:hypothetical protein